jgi:hypothetical protein
VEFFNGSTSAATKASLLQNSSKFSAVFASEASNSQASLTAAQVTAVSDITSTTATVTWSLLLSGSPVLPNQKGQAVYEGGTWKVSATAFCSLLGLQPTAATKAACKA